jgi:shikimate kinase
MIANYSEILTINNLKQSIKDLLSTKYQAMKIFLVGYMGCGKSTVGKELAHMLNFPFYDTDQIIEKTENNSISNIFQEQGEDAFRLKERKVLIEMLDRYPSGIFSTGGGMPCFLDNMKLMNKGGYTVFINCGVNLLYDRLGKSKNRPVIKGKTEYELKKFISNHLLQRRPYYNLAKIKVMGYDSPGNISNRIISKVNKL